MSKRIHVIINPSAGSEQPVLRVLNTVFREYGAEWDVSLTKETGDARRQAQQAAQAGVDVVAVYGGDGTVSEAASGLVGGNVPLAIFPGGTSNAIALALGIPLDLAKACALTCSPTPGFSDVRTVDMGSVNDQSFLIGVGIGIPGVLAEGADREQKNLFGPFAYVLSSIQALRNAPAARYHMILDGKPIESEGVICLIANSGNFGIAGVSLANSIDMADGLLDVIVVGNAALGSLLSLASSVMRQDETTAPFDHWQAREVTVTAEPPQAIQADGEVLPPGPVSAKILPGAVRFIVPGHAAAT
jgi:diacylglycerol kinase (ATP)